MILADKFLSYEHNPGVPFAAIMADRIRMAAKYRLDDQVVASGVQVASSKPSSILSAMDYCRVPFQSVWIEWSHLGMLKARDLKGLQDPNKSTPKSVAMLLEMDEDDGRHGVASMAWDDCEKEGVMLSPLALRIDWGVDLSTKDIETPDELRAWIDANPAKVSKSHYQKLRNNDAELEAMAQVEGFYDFIYHPNLQDGHLLGEERTEFYAADWKGEMGFVQSILILMNSRNGCSIEDVDLERLNRARVKRGKPELQHHRRVQLHMEIKRRDRLARRGLSREDIQRHLVARHPKVRKTGVFWWSPHMRGNRGGAKIPEYDVSD